MSTVSLQAEEAHLLVAAFVSRRMAALLEMFVPHLSNATVRTAVNHLAVGMGAFKSEDLSMAEDAARVLPLLHKFIVAILPHCNRAFTAASTNSACPTEPLMPYVGAVCDVLTLAIKTFESAVEVTLRYKIQGASELSRYASHGMLCSLDLFPTPQCIYNENELSHSKAQIMLILVVSECSKACLNAYRVCGNVVGFSMHSRRGTTSVYS